MLNKIIESSINNRKILLFISLLLLGFGYVSMQRLTVDAIPDLSDVQVIIESRFPDQPAKIVEDLLSYPLSNAMLSVPFAKTVRAYSFFGISYVYVIFEDGTDIYWARSRVLEYLNSIQSKLPKTVSSKLGPDASSVGWVYQYSLTDSSGRYDLSDLTSLQNWKLKFELESLEGVSEVATVGGFQRVYRIIPDPQKLYYYNLNINDLAIAVQKSNSEKGARLLEQSEAEFMISIKGYYQNPEDIGNTLIVNKSENAVLRLTDLAEVMVTGEMRRGIADKNGEGEVVGGIIVMRSGENAKELIQRVKKRVSELKENLPAGIVIHEDYNRSILIDSAIDNLSSTLIKEMLIVAILIFIFLLHWKSAFVAIISIPLGIFISMIVMDFMSINANIMSLAGIGIAIGVMVDASIVMVENAHKRIEEWQKQHDSDRFPVAILIESAQEVGPALFYSLMIISISFLPVFFLEEIEGRMFKPLVITKTLVMLISTLIAVTVIPALMVFFVKGKIMHEEDHPINRVILKIYKPILQLALSYPKWIISSAVILILLSVIPFMKTGSEFMPALEENEILYMPTTLPSISIEKAREILQVSNRIIKSFPEVSHVFGKLGRAETATDPAPISMLETIIHLKDESQWREGMTRKKLIEEMNAALNIPGLSNAWTQPIRTRIDMLATGIRTSIGLKLSGPNIADLQKSALEIEQILSTLPEFRSVFAERVMEGRYLDIIPDRKQMQLHGFTDNIFQSELSAILGSLKVGETIEGLERYAIQIRYPQKNRDSEEAISQLLIRNTKGDYRRLGDLAKIEWKSGPDMIKSENARPNVWIYLDTEERDLASVVKKAKDLIKDSIQLDDAIQLRWSGQYEYMERVKASFSYIIPLTLAVIFIILLIYLKSISESLIILMSLPFHIVGSIWLIYIMEHEMSVASVVGFIAVAGLATETAILMEVYLKASITKYRESGRMTNLEDLDSAIMEGAGERVRPKLMTVATSLFALIPMMISSDVGAETMQRIATPMVGGLISSTVLTLIVLPSLYKMIYRKYIMENN